MKKLLACLAIILGSAGAMAGAATATATGTQPFNLSLTPDVAVYNRSETIEGVTLSIWGENPQTSFALGIANGATARSAGFSWGILNYADYYKGAQLGLVNYNKNESFGWQGFFSAIVNFTTESVTGLQTGVVNYAGRLKGVQFGIVNYAKDGDSSVQIGLINIIPKNKEWFSKTPDELAPGMILVNWRF